MKSPPVIAAVSLTVLSLLGTNLPCWGVEHADEWTASALYGEWRPSGDLRFPERPLQEDLSQERLATVQLEVEGMTCGGCAVAVRVALKKLQGVTKAQVSYEKRSAAVTYDPARVEVAAMIEAIADLGFRAKR